MCAGGWVHFDPLLRCFSLVSPLFVMVDGGEEKTQQRENSLVRLEASSAVFRCDFGMTGQKRHRTKKDIIGRENRYLLAASDWSIIFLYHSKGIFILTMQLPGLVRYGGTDGLELSTH